MSLVVFDLDNTLYDWLEMWHASFSAMLSEVVRISGLNQEDLEPQIRLVFQRHGTSEYSFLLQELDVLKELHRGEGVLDIYQPAIEAYKQARGEHLSLYPGTLEAMRALRLMGIKLAAYTESLEWFTRSRVKALGLDGVLDRIYSPPDHDIPESVDLDVVRKRKAEEYELLTTEHHLIGRGVVKPNADVLRSIIKDMGGRPELTCYVGDSLMKDILMAQHAGVHDVLAQYGAGQSRPEYELLRRVSHWTEEDVERERHLLKGQTVTASTVLHDSLREIFMHFEFRSAQATQSTEAGLAVEAWKTAIDVQMHFNDIELRVRNFAITVLAALLGTAGIAIQIDRSVTLGAYRIPLATVFMGAALIAWLGFFFMDRVWYHPLLKGAVLQAEDLERYLKDIIPDIGLTQRISASSPVKVFGWKIHSKHKMLIFYLGIGFVIVAIGLSTLILRGREAPAHLVGTTAEGEAICGTTVGADGQWVISAADGRIFPIESITAIEEVDACS